MEFGAWFEQQLLQSKDEGEFSGDALFSGINFKKENKKEDPGSVSYTHLTLPTN